MSLGPQGITIEIRNSVAEATNYVKENEQTPGKYKQAEIERFQIVRNGTEGRRSTVDLVFKDEAGQLYVVMLTGRLLRMVGQAVGEE